MAQKKLFRFAQVSSFSNVLEYPENMKGNWQDHFGNSNPIILELACGRGEYTYELAGMHPDSNFIGVDIKGNRMYIGAKKALDQNLQNAAFLRTQIEMLPNYFNAGEVAEIWITFPDPHLRTSKAKKRLTHPRFLRLYKQVLRAGGRIHLKTDSPHLYNFTKHVAGRYGLTIQQDVEDLYASANVAAELSIRTHYEKMDIAKSNRIFYLSFTLPAEIPDHDAALKEYLTATENV